MRSLAFLLVAALPLSAQAPAPPIALQAPHATALGLTPEQQAQRKAILEKYRGEARANHEALHAQAQAFRATMRDPKASEAQLRQAFDQINSQQFRLMLDRRAMRQELRAVLTPEQQLKADAMRVRFQERRRARMERRIRWMRERLDQNQ